MADGLQYLLKAPSKKLVDELFIAAFKHRVGDTSEFEAEAAKALSITEEEAEKVCIMMTFLLHGCC